MKTGYIQVYTGNGKGKTTAALGLVLRAVGAGLRVGIIQFCKGQEFSELQSINLLGNLVKHYKFGEKSFIKDVGTDADRLGAQEAMDVARNLIKSNELDILVLDEANIAVHFNLITINDLLEILRTKNPELEVIITGRNAHADLIDLADLVTEMREVKHYFTKGVMARKGIES